MRRSRRWGIVPSMSQNEDPEASSQVPFGVGWVVSSAIQSIGSRGLFIALRFLGGVFLVRAAGPAARGVVVLIESTAVLLGGLSSLGIGVSAQYHLSRGSREREVTSIAIALSMAIGALLACVLWVFAEPASRLFLPNVDYGEDLIRLGGLQVGLWMILMNVDLVLVGLDRMRIRNVLLPLSAVCFIAGLGIAAWGDGITTYEAVVASVASHGVAVAIGLIALVRVTGFTPRWERSVLADVMGFGLRQHGSGVGITVFKRVEVYALAHLLSTRHVGIYSIAANLWDVVMLPVSSVQQLSLSTFAARARDEGGRLAMKLASGAGLIAIVVAALAGVASIWVIPAVYGDSVRGAIGPAMILLCAVPISAASGFFVYYLRGVNRPGTIARVHVFAAAVNVGLTFALIPVLGMRGNALATVISHVLILAITFAIFRRIARIGDWRSALVGRAEAAAALAMMRTHLSGARR